MSAARPLPGVDAASLHEAAVAYLARYAATRVGLRRVLERRIDRWLRAAAGKEEDAEAVAAGARAAIDAIVARLADAGAVDDKVFAETRARRLAQSGKSRRAVSALLAAKGVDAETAAQAIRAAPGNELAAALVFARRRRIGPFRAADSADRRRELGMLGRAGFAAETAGSVLRMTRDEAELMLAEWNAAT